MHLTCERRVGLHLLEHRRFDLYRARQASGDNLLLRNNLLIYGLGGLIVPFIGIKAVDLVLGLFI